MNPSSIKTSINTHLRVSKIPKAVVKPVVGEIVVVPFPRTGGKRRPALVIADLPGADLILC